MNVIGMAVMKNEKDDRLVDSTITAKSIVRLIRSGVEKSMQCFGQTFWNCMVANVIVAE